MNKLETYLFFDGRCAEAMRFYQSVLGGKLSLLPASDAPEGVPFPRNDKIMHSKLELDGAIILASDWLAASPYPGMGGFSVTLEVPKTTEARSLFDKLAAGGRTTMPFSETFYCGRFGRGIDKFGRLGLVVAGQMT